MTQSEAKNPLTEQLSLLLTDVDELSEMLEKGYGDKAFRRKLHCITSRAKALRAALSPVDQSQDKEESAAPTAVVSQEPVMILGDDGEQRPATKEDLDALEKAGAPVLGPQDRTDFTDNDFGGGRGDEGNDVV